MSNVKKFVNQQLMMKEVADDMEESKIRFSVTVAPDVNRRLEYCAKKLDHSRSGLANALIEQALSEVEEALGLKFEVDGQLSDYAKEIYAIKKPEVS